MASYESANKQADLARLGLATTENSILLEGLIAYFSVVRDKKLADLAESAEVLTKTTESGERKGRKRKGYSP